MLLKQCVFWFLIYLVGVYSLAALSDVVLGFLYWEMSWDFIKKLLEKGWLPVRFLLFIGAISAVIRYFTYYEIDYYYEDEYDGRC